MQTKHNWTKEEILDIYNQPFLDLLYQAASIHRENKDYAEVQISSLIPNRSRSASNDEG